MTSQRILVIDDSKEIVRHLTQQVLPTFGFETLSAGNGLDGLKMIREKKPDLVMLDLNLPEMNGLDVLRELARDAVSAPVILMTGYGSEKDAIEAFRLGIRDYLVKPFTVDEVLETINKVLEQEKKRYGNSEQLSEDVRRLKTEISRLINETNTLFSIGKAVASLLDVNKVIERVLEAAIYLTNAEESTIWVHDKDTEELHAFAKKGYEKQFRPVNLKKDSLVGQVLRDGRPVRQNAFSGEGIKVQTGFLARRAVLHVPLSLRGVTMGVLSVSNLRAPRPFSERHEFLLTVLADYAVTALENSRIFQDTDKALSIGMEELKTLNQITRTVTSHLDLSEIVRLTIQQVHASWDVDAASLWLYNEETQTLRVLQNAGTEDWDILGKLEVPVEKGFVGHVVRTGKWIYTNDATSHPLHYKGVDNETGFNTHSLLCVPMIFRDKVTGAMQLINKRNGKFDERDVERARSIASAVAIAFSNALLFRQAESRKQQLEAVLEHSSNPTVIVDNENRLLLMNQPARSLLRVDTTALGLLASQMIKQREINALLNEPTDAPQKGKLTVQNVDWLYTLAPIPGFGGKILFLQNISEVAAFSGEKGTALMADIRQPLTEMHQLLAKLQHGDSKNGTQRALLEELSSSINELSAALERLPLERETLSN